MQYDKYISACLKTSTLEQEIANDKDVFIMFRLLASFLVLYAHSYHVYGVGADPITPRIGIYTGTFAVYVFFSISGFFIIRSAMERNIYQYLLARFFRIYPALIACNLLTVIVIIPIATGFNWYSFLFSQETLDYIKINSLLDTLKFTISGVFEGNPDQAINGSLWTLPVEVRAYVIALLLVMIGVTERKAKFNALLFVAIFLNVNLPEVFVSLFPIPGSTTLLLYFFLGGGLYVNREWVLVSPFLVIMTAFIIVFFRGELSPIVLSMLVTYLVISSGYILSRFFNVKLKSDYSYGCYLYAYPISQLSFMLLSGVGFYYYLSFIVFVTFVFSFVSWHLVEKPINSIVRFKVLPVVNESIIYK